MTTKTRLLFLRLCLDNVPLLGRHDIVGLSLLISLARLDFDAVVLVLLHALL